MDKKELIKKLRLSKKNLKRKGVEKIILFGSRTTGNYRKDSDVDLIMVGKGFHGKKYGRSVGLRKYLGLDMPVDLLCYTPEEFGIMSKRITIVKQALKEGIEI